MNIEIRVAYEDENAVHVVLWASRHPPLPVQVDALKAKLGRVKILQVSGVIPNAEWLMNQAKQVKAEIIVPVLPLSFIARLVELAKKEGVTVLWPQMKVVAQVPLKKIAENIVAENPRARTMTTYADGSVKVHEFDKFYVVEKVELVLKPW